MHRPTLVLRRFGDLSFGLGYIQDGTWVDHASPAAIGYAIGTTPAERAALDAIHAWFDCCRERSVAIAPETEEPATVVAVATANPAT